MTGRAVLGSDGRAVVVAVDHPLYSWPCVGLEDRAAAIGALCEAGADAVIATYGAIRDDRAAFGDAAAICKLDLTTLTIGGSYPVTEYAVAYGVDDAVRVGADAVLTFVQLGSDAELEALRSAARVAAAADRLGVPYVCEIMPVTSERFPDPTDQVAIAGAARTAAELGAHIVKTTMPDPPVAVAGACAVGLPVILAGGDLADDREALFRSVGDAIGAGSSGVAFGRNAWGSDDPAGTVGRLVELVHGGGNDG